MGRGRFVRCRVGMKQERARLHGGKNLKYKYIKVLSAVEPSPCQRVYGIGIDH